MQQTITCRHCQETIGPELWRLFQHLTCTVGHGPEALAAQAAEAAADAQRRWRNGALGTTA